MRGFAITAQGAQLLTKVAGGAGTLQITAVKVGKGLPEGDPSLLTDLVSAVALGSCTVPKVENNRMSMVVEYRNDMDGGLKEDFMLSEFGIFAKVKELEEDAVLLYIGVLGDNPGVVSAWNGNNLESRRYPVSIVVSKDLQVEINFPAGAFITSDEFDEAMETHNKSISSHSDIRAMATETYNPETTYTAGAYCIHDGKLYKAQADISAPEEWTESHWTLTSVGAELRELETALSNKLSRNGKLVPLGTNILTLSPGRYSIDGVTEDTRAQMNLPVLVWHYEIVVLGTNDEVGLINNYKVITVYPFGYSQGYIESFTNEMQYDGTWTGWVKNTTATPPQEYPLPLTEGFTPITPCTYRKNQFSEVFVGGSTGGTITDGTVIATLPEGFRPKQIVERPATFAVSGAQAAGSVTIMPDGNVSVHGQSAASGVVFSANFVVDE